MTVPAPLSTTAVDGPASTAPAATRSACTLRDESPKQPRELARVRRQDRGSRPLLKELPRVDERVERISIDDERQRQLRHESASGDDGSVSQGQTRAEHHRVVVARQLKRLVQRRRGEARGCGPAASPTTGIDSRWAWAIGTTESGTARVT